MSKVLRSPLIALALAGLLWGLTVPLSKVVLEWLDGGWLTVARFGMAAPILAFVARGRLRAAFTPAVLGAGAAGYGIVIMLQNAGIGRTSVSHAALIVGVVPALVALIAATTGGGRTPARAWIGFALALGGVGLVAGGGGGAATLQGDALVGLSVTLSAVFIVAQPVLLKGRDPIAVTAVQMLAGMLAALPNAALEGLPEAPPTSGTALALVALTLAGTLAPFALFAYGQSRVAPELAGAFLNLEPLVGTAAGALAFGDPFGAPQLIGGAVILTGIALSTGRAPAGDRTAERAAHASHAARIGSSARSAGGTTPRSEEKRNRPDRQAGPGGPGSGRGVRPAALGDAGQLPPARSGAVGGFAQAPSTSP